uniref:tetraspanin-1-like n=1 Tax=Myxine glutinosa TaxID=7769 RepID=UPI00358ECCE7
MAVAQATDPGVQALRTAVTGLRVTEVSFDGAGTALLGGLTLLAAGIWVKVDGSSFNNILGPAVNVHFANVGYFCIAVGLLLIVIGFIGCVGAYKESKCLLITFFIIVLIILIAQIAAAVAALVYADVAEDIVKAEASQHLKEEYGKKSNPKGKIITEVWDLFMSKAPVTDYTILIEARPEIKEKRMMKGV